MFSETVASEKDIVKTWLRTQVCNCFLNTMSKASACFWQSLQKDQKIFSSTVRVINLHIFPYFRILI